VDHLLLLLLAFLWILKTIPNAQTQTEERERRTHVHTRTLYILRRAMASALRVPATTVATVGRSKALLIDVCRRSRPRLVESSIRARRASSSSCGNWLPHRFLVASPPLGGRRRSTAAAAAQWRGLRRPAGLSMLSLRASSTGWLLLPPPSYAVERRSFSRSTSTQAVIAAPPPPKTGANPELVKELGFEVLEERFINEYKSTATLYRHKKTGAEIMSVTNDDENKVFGIVFRTPPKDSTGIPHILEHSVLCGSRKYPLKEPFVELLKGSLHTFLNAFTYPDRTCYPVASTNLKDFYNLVDVYLDAVFHPRCVNEVQTFQQEGWHYELNDPSEDITYKGVVFNEMKGVYSQPDNVLGRVSQQVCN
jgi:hypothetical protein